MSHLVNTFTDRPAGRRVLRRRERLTTGQSARIVFRVALVLALSCLCWIGVGWVAFTMYRLVAR
jgi:hypothetical protein